MSQETIIGLYTKKNCTYCDQAKALLKNRKLEYKEYTVETADERMQLKKEFPDARTFPVVVIDHKWIGGYTQLADWLRTNK